MIQSFNEFWEKAADKGSAAEAGKEIPQDIWEAAEKIAYEYEDGDKLAGRLKSLIMRSLMDERSQRRWQPIETAPASNGSSPFLAFIPGHGQCVCAKSITGQVYALSGNRKVHRATCWQPLPSPPVPTKG